MPKSRGKKIPPTRKARLARIKERANTHLVNQSFVDAGKELARTRMHNMRKKTLASGSEKAPAVIGAIQDNVRENNRRAVLHVLRTMHIFDNGRRGKILAAVDRLMTLERVESDLDHKKRSGERPLPVQLRAVLQTRSAPRELEELLGNRRRYEEFVRLFDDYKQKASSDPKV